MKPISVRYITRPNRRRAARVTLVVAALACTPPVNGVRVLPGTTPAHPRFLVTDSSGATVAGLIYGLSVVRCGTDSSAWTITTTGALGTIGGVTYGEAPAGYASTAGPDSLRAGCYDVFVTDGRRARFRVDVAGQVVVVRDGVRAPRVVTDTARR